MNNFLHLPQTGSSLTMVKDPRASFVYFIQSQLNVIARMDTGMITGDLFIPVNDRDLSINMLLNEYTE